MIELGVTGGLPVRPREVGVRCVLLAIDLGRHLRISLQCRFLIQVGHEIVDICCGGGLRFLGTALLRWLARGVIGSGVGGGALVRGTFGGWSIRWDQGEHLVDKDRVFGGGEGGAGELSSHSGPGHGRETCKSGVGVSHVLLEAELSNLLGDALLCVLQLIGDQDGGVWTWHRAGLVLLVIPDDVRARGGERATLFRTQEVQLYKKWGG